MSKIDLVPITGAQNLSAINDNFQKIEDALNEKVLYRDNPPAEPNQVESDVDMNGKRLYNLPEPKSDGEPVRRKEFGDVKKSIRVADKELPTLPPAYVRRNKLLSFDALGNPVVSYPSNDSATQLRLDLNSYTGTIAASPEWSDVPAHSDSAFDVQAQALANRVEALKTGDGVDVRFDKDMPVTTLTGFISKQPVPLELLGFKGDYVTDNRTAWNRLIALFEAGVTHYTCGPGAFSITGSVDWPYGLCIKGAGAPQLGFGTNDCKMFLSPGKQKDIPGTAFFFKGSGTEKNLERRTDEFSVVKPAVTVSRRSGINYNAPSKCSGFAIVQDMICVTESGEFTKPGFENKSDFDVGLLLNDVARNPFEDVVVFGYFDKAGTIIFSKQGNDDPDYNRFNGGSTMGRKGLAIIGANDAPASYGLSGTSASNFGLYTLDHHSRGVMTTAERTAYYADASTWRCLFIDGDVDASSAEINGHYFYNCELRTRADHALELGKASNVQFYGGVVEQALYGIPGSSNARFIASSEVKRGVGFYGVRMNYTSQIFNELFAGTLTVPLYVSGDPLNGRFAIVNKDPAGGWTASVMGSGGGVGDSSFQLTKNVNDGSSGWRIKVDVSEPDFPLQIAKESNVILEFDSNGVQRNIYTNRTINDSGEIDVNGPLMLVGVGTSDGNLYRINGGKSGQKIVIRPSTSSTTINIQRTGNIRLPGGVPMSITGSTAFVELIHNGSVWCYLSGGNTL